MCSTLQRAVCAIAALFLPAYASAQHDLNAAVLDRAAFVRAVLDTNPSIEAARQGWRGARARVRQAGAFEDPMIELAMAPLSIGSSEARFGYEIEISQQLPWFGKRAAERATMQAEAAAAGSDLELTRRELAMAALELYHRYYVAVRSLEINAQHLALMQSFRSAALAQLEAGRGSAPDALQAEAELTRLERDAVLLEAERRVVIAQMNELLHRAPETALPPPVSVLTARLTTRLAARGPLDSEQSKKLEQEAVQQSAEVSSARLHARAEAAKADAAAREYYPSFSIATSYSSMWDMPEHRWMVGVGLNVPLPNGRRAGAIDEARAARAQYESQLARLSDRARTQVYVQLQRLEESDRVLALFETRLLPVARDQVDVAQAGFVASQAPFMAVVEAERSLRSVELEQTVAQAEREQRYAELQRLLGRIPGFEESRP